MPLNELFPILIGLSLGAILNLIPASRRWTVGFPLIVSAGLWATVVSGEYLVSWAFVLIDVLLAGGAALAGYAAVYYVRRFWRGQA